MNIEHKEMKFRSVGNSSIGYIQLDKLAIPETVKVTLLGEPIIPMSFDCYGQPNFSDEQAMLFIFKREELQRQNGANYTPLKAEIVYEERLFKVSPRTFDTIKGIEKSLRSLSDLNEMLNNRRMSRAANPQFMLNEFMLFGCFWLDKFGQIQSVEKSSYGKLKTCADVEYYDTFEGNNKGDYWFSSDGYAIPTAGSVCPCCGKELTIEDVKNNPCVYIDGKFYHDSCWCNYRKLTEVDKFTRRLMNLVYKRTDYTFELLPNAYWPEYSDSIPWLLFHTIDGDIIIGWRKRVISIEWQENYKPFDINALFSKEGNITKWNENGKRGIHASSSSDAFGYLTKVLEAVNPTYSLF